MYDVCILVFFCLKFLSIDYPSQLHYLTFKTIHFLKICENLMTTYGSTFSVF